jgi:hypothetical protein
MNSYQRAREEWERMVRETPFFASDHTDLYEYVHGAGGVAYFATLAEAVAWLKARGDCGTVLQIDVGPVYTGSVKPRRPKDH